MANKQHRPLNQVSTRLTRFLFQDQLTRRERADLTDKIRTAWTAMAVCVMRSAPRLSTEYLADCLDERGNVRSPLPFTLPLDIVWGTDKVVDGRLFIFFAVLDTDTQERSVFCIHEQQRPGDLPICWSGLAGFPADIFASERVVADHETVTGLFRLFREGAVRINRAVAINADTAEISTIALRLQTTVEGFAPPLNKQEIEPWDHLQSSSPELPPSAELPPSPLSVEASSEPLAVSVTVDSATPESNSTKE